jgi:hypothetical protein
MRRKNFHDGKSDPSALDLPGYASLGLLIIEKSGYGIRSRGNREAY